MLDIVFLHYVADDQRLAQDFPKLRRWLSLYNCLILDAHLQFRHIYRVLPWRLALGIIVLLFVRHLEMARSSAAAIAKKKGGDAGQQGSSGSSKL